MDRVAVFVDAGYLFAAGSQLIAGSLLRRGEMQLDVDATLALLAREAERVASLPLLRIYWYDGTSTGPTPQQLALGYKPNVKLRLGFVNQQGEQKGVDSLIVSDLINLARNRSMADALVLSGDEDIRVGVMQAQEFGVRVHLLGIEPARSNQSGFLVQEADTTHEISREAVVALLKIRPQQEDSLLSTTSELGAVPSASVAATLIEIAHRAANNLSEEEAVAVLGASRGGMIPPEIDRRLLGAASRAMNFVPLNPEEKRRLRDEFRQACARRSNNA